MTGTPKIRPAPQTFSNTNVSLHQEKPGPHGRPGGQSRKASFASKGEEPLHRYDWNEADNSQEWANSIKQACASDAQNSGSEQANADGAPAKPVFSNAGPSGGGADAPKVDRDANDPQAPLQGAVKTAAAQSNREPVKGDDVPADAAFNNFSLNDSGADVLEADQSANDQQTPLQENLKNAKIQGDNPPNASVEPENAHPRTRLFSRDSVPPSSASLVSTLREQEADVSAKDIGLRPAPDRDNRPFKDLNMFDRIYLWMRENPTTALYLSCCPFTAFGFGLLMPISFLIGGIRDYFRSDTNFGQTETPDRPKNGIYYQQKPQNHGHSLQYSVSAALGRPSGITEAEFADWRKEHENVFGVVDATSSVTELLSKTGCDRTCENHEWESGWDPTDILLFGEQRNLQRKNADFTTVLDEAQRSLQHKDVNFAIVCIKRWAGWPLLHPIQKWVTFRKDPDISDPDKAWTKIDSSQYIRDRANGFQPTISPSEYLRQKQDEPDFMGFTITCPSADGNAAGAGARSNAGLVGTGDTARVKNADIEKDNDRITTTSAPKKQVSASPRRVGDAKAAAAALKRQKQTFNNNIKQGKNFIKDASGIGKGQIKKYKEKYHEEFYRYKELNTFAELHSQRLDSMNTTAHDALSHCKFGEDVNKNESFQYFVKAYDAMKHLEERLRKEERTLQATQKLDENNAGSELERKTIYNAKFAAADQLDCVFAMRKAVGQDVEYFRNVLDTFKHMPSFGQSYDHGGDIRSAGQAEIGDAALALNEEENTFNLNLARDLCDNAITDAENNRIPIRKRYNDTYKTDIAKYGPLKSFADQHSKYQNDFLKSARTFTACCKLGQNVTTDPNYMSVVTAYESMKQLALELNKKQNTAVGNLACVYDMKLAVESDVKAFREILANINNVSTLCQPDDSRIEIRPAESRVDIDNAARAENAAAEQNANHATMAPYWVQSQQDFDKDTEDLRQLAGAMKTIGNTAISAYNKKYSDEIKHYEPLSTLAKRHSTILGSVKSAADFAIADREYKKDVSGNESFQRFITAHKEMEQLGHELEAKDAKLYRILNQDENKVQSPTEKEKLSNKKLMAQKQIGCVHAMEEAVKADIKNFQKVLSILEKM